jgi:hypothetical protein
LLALPLALPHLGAFAVRLLALEFRDALVAFTLLPHPREEVINGVRGRIALLVVVAGHILRELALKPFEPPEVLHGEKLRGQKRETGGGGRGGRGPLVPRVSQAFFACEHARMPPLRRPLDAQDR